MSYSAQAGDNSTGFSFYPTTPMVLDIQAIQYIYGANNNYHPGNDTYLFSDINTYHETIWDAGGTDTIQYSGYLNSTIDLRAGYGSDIGLDVYQQSAYGLNLQAINNIWIAQDATIENAIGGYGNDLLTGNIGNNSLDGGAGIDTALYTTSRMSFNVKKTGDHWEIKNLESAYDNDSLVSIERLQFSDMNVALDTTDGNASKAAKILGAVFGAGELSNKEYVGIGLDYLDNGMAYQDLMLLALNVKLGNGFSNAAEVALIYQNLVGTPPTTEDMNYWGGTLTSGQFTQTSLAEMAGEHSLNTANINLVGLAQTGIEFI